MPYYALSLPVVERRRLPVDEGLARARYLVNELE
jgi:hypothetical protein